MDARAGPDGRRPAAVEVEDPLTLENVDDLVVDMAMHAGPARRDHAHELRDVQAAHVLVDEVAKLAVRARRQHGLLAPAHGPAARRRVVLLRRGHGDDDELLRAGRLDLVLLARHDVDAGERLERVRGTVDVERALAGDDEEHLLAVPERTWPRPAAR